MAAIDEYNNAIDSHKRKVNRLKTDIRSLTKQINEIEVKVARNMADASSMLERAVVGLSDVNVIKKFTTLENKLQKQVNNSNKKVINTDIEDVITKWSKIKQRHKVLKEQLDYLCNDINDYLTRVGNRPRGVKPVRKVLGIMKKIPNTSENNSLKNKRARDIAKISSIYSTLTNIKNDFKTTTSAIKNMEKNYKTMNYSWPKPVHNVIKSVNLLLSGLQKSSESIDGFLDLIDKEFPVLPESAAEWLEILRQRLIEREHNKAPNLSLNSTDIRNFSSNLFDSSIDSRSSAIIEINRESTAMEKFSNDLLGKIDFKLLDMRKQSTKKQQLSKKVETMVKSAINKISDSDRKLQSIAKWEDYQNTLNEKRHNILNDATDSTRRHFKEDIFAIQLIAALKMKPSNFLTNYKKSWHIYPNYYLCHNEIKKSDKGQRKLDELVKLPISSNLLKACLLDEITKEQAIILQDIDEHDDLFQLSKSHNIELDLIFALHAQESKQWLGALLENPELHDVIAQYRHDGFDDRLWKLVVDNKLKPWQYACVIRLEFDDETALETLLLADDLWSELHEFASLYDVQDDLKHLTEVYSPKKTKSPSSGTITLSDVFNVVKPMGNVTVNKSIAKTKLVTRKKKGRYKITKNR